MNHKLVSTITAVYRNYDNLFRTLDSIFAQDYPRIQIVLSDDGSKEWETAKTEIEKYIQNNKSDNIESYKLLHLPANMGTVKNVNNAIKATDGDYVKPIGCGDCLVNRSVITNCVEEMMTLNCLVLDGIVYKMSSDNGEIIKTFFPERKIRKLNSYSSDVLNKKLYNNCIIPAVGILFDKKLFDKYGFYDENYKYIEDHPYWLKITRQGEKIHFSNQEVALYYTGGISNGGNPELQAALKKDYMRIISEEIEPYNKGDFSKIDNQLRRRRADFVFDMRAAEGLRGKIICAICNPASAAYYMLREIKER